MPKHQRPVQHQQDLSAFTLIEVLISATLLSLIMGATIYVLNTLSTLESNHISRTQQQASAQKAMKNMISPVKETAYRLVDTQMRWREGENYQVSDKFYARYDEIDQCTNNQCTWLWNPSTGEYNSQRSRFGANYNALIDSPPNDEAHVSEHLFSPLSNRGTGHAGRIYTDYPPQNPTNPKQCPYDGSQLSPWVSLDVLQFPTARNVKGNFIMNEGGNAKADWQGFLIYAPYVNRETGELTLRRYAIYLSDFFRKFRWQGSSPYPKNPLYRKAPSNPNTRVDLGTISNDTLNAATSIAASPDAAPVSRSRPSPLQDYNQIKYPGQQGFNIPRDWGPNPSLYDEKDNDNDGVVDNVEEADLDDKPLLHDLFDFDGDGLIETQVNARDGDRDGDGNPIDVGIINGDPTPDSDASFEQFRLFPSESLYHFIGGSGWWDDPVSNPTQALVYHKVETDPDKLKNTLTGSYQHIELYYFIDLETGWTRLYYYCKWEWKGSTEELEINASFVRQPYEALPDNDRTKYFTPYEQIATSVNGLEFSTPQSYPHDDSPSAPDYEDGDTAGVDSESNVRMSILLENRKLQKGSTNFITNQDSQTVHARHPLSVNVELLNPVN